MVKKNKKNKKEKKQKAGTAADGLRKWLDSLSDSESMPKAYLYHILQNMKGGYLMDRASTLAYNILMATIPLIMALVQMASQIVANPEYALEHIMVFLPGRLGNMIQAVVSYISANSSGLTIGIGFIIAIWLGSNGVHQFIKEINESLGFNDSNGEAKGPKGRLIAILYTVIFMVIIILVLVFYVFYNQLFLPFFRVSRQNAGGTAHFEGLFEFMDSFVAKTLPLVLFILVLVLFYKSAPKAVNRTIRWVDALVGGILAGIGVFIITWIYSLIVDNISKLSVYFGSLASILFLLFWFRFICFILLAGAEAMVVYRHIHSKEVLMAEEGLNEFEAEARVEWQKRKEAYRKAREKEILDLKNKNQAQEKKNKPDPFARFIHPSRKEKVDRKKGETPSKLRHYRGLLPADRKDQPHTIHNDGISLEELKDIDRSIEDEKLDLIEPQEFLADHKALEEEKESQDQLDEKSDEKEKQKSEKEKSKGPCLGSIRPENKNLDQFEEEGEDKQLEDGERESQTQQ